MLSFFKKIKNNKGFDEAIVGTVLILLLFTCTAIILDINSSITTKSLVLSKLENAEIYGLVSGLDYNPTRYGDLGVNHVSAYNSCRSNLLGTRSYLLSKNIVDNFNIVNIYVDPWKQTADNFADGKTRYTYGIEATVSFKPKNYIKAPVPFFKRATYPSQNTITLRASSRVFLE